MLDKVNNQVTERISSLPRLKDHSHIYKNMTEINYTLDLIKHKDTYKGN